MSERGIKHCCSSLYYPQANGAVERFNAVLKNTVQNAIHSGRSWKEALLQFLGIYRATVHATTGVSPSVLAHGRHMRTKLNIVGRDLPRVDMSDVRNREQEKQRKYKFYADKRRNTRTAIFNVGDWVRVKRHGRFQKGEKSYSDPIQIANEISSFTFQMSDGRKWNISKLVKCNPQSVICLWHLIRVMNQIVQKKQVLEEAAETGNAPYGNRMAVLLCINMCIYKLLHGTIL